MNRFFGLFLALLWLGCQAPEKNKGEFALLPLPETFTVSGPGTLAPEALTAYYLPEGIARPPMGPHLEGLTATAKASDAQVVLAIDPEMALKAEGYTLTISGGTVHITGKDDAGLFYGIQTLGQLVEDAQEQNAYLPKCSISDAPKLAYRAVHWDVKHHLEKTSYYYELLDELAGFKINAVIVELEDKLAYPSRPLIGSQDALDTEEWIKLSDYAQARHIQISPLVQGLGHASFILKHPEYAPLRDDPESDWAFNPLDPETYALQFDLYRDAMAATPHGKYLHIGGDEVHTTGRGSGKSALELQLIWLNKVCAFAEAHHRTPIFWDDMPLKQTGVYRAMFQPGLSPQQVDSIWAVNGPKLSRFLDQFPKNCIYMRWNYSTPEALGNTKAMEWFTEHGLQAMGATAGQTRWVLMPQKESNMESIRAFAESSIQKNLNGLLLTLWDDDSPHFELYKRGIAAFAEYTWSGERRTKDAIKAAFRQRYFSHAMAADSLAFIDRLETPVAFWKNALLQGNRRNQLRTLENPMENGVIPMPDGASPGAWSETYADRLETAGHVLAACDSVAATLALAADRSVRHPYTLEVYGEVEQMARYAPRVLLALKAYDTATDPTAKRAALTGLHALEKEFDTLRQNLEQVYGQTRMLNKPEGYILDQDHHDHLANQALDFSDWQFYAEQLFLDKLHAFLEKEDQVKP